MKNRKERYRIEDIGKARINGRNVKTFKAFEYNKEAGAYIFCGEFSAPAKTANKNLKNFIEP